MTIVYDLEELREAMDDRAAFGGLGREGGLSATGPFLLTVSWKTPLK